MKSIVFIFLSLILVLACEVVQAEPPGQVRFNTECVTVTPTINTTAYSAGDCLHASAIEVADAALTAAGTGYVTSVLITDKAANAANIDVVLFESEPTTICSGINNAFDPADADLLEIIGGGAISVVAHGAFSDNGVSQATELDRPFSVDSGTSLYLALVMRSNSITYAVGDLSVKICFKQD